MPCVRESYPAGSGRSGHSLSCIVHCRPLKLFVVHCALRALRAHPSPIAIQKRRRRHSLRYRHPVGFAKGPSQYDHDIPHPPRTARRPHPSHPCNHAHAHAPALARRLVASSSSRIVGSAAGNHAASLSELPDDRSVKKRLRISSRSDFSWCSKPPRPSLGAHPTPCYATGTPGAPLRSPFGPGTHAATTPGEYSACQRPCGCLCDSTRRSAETMLP